MKKNTNGENTMRIAFIGGGNIAYAIASGVLKKGNIPQKDITITDIRESRLDFIRENLQVNTTHNNVEAIRNAEIIIIAVKPNVFDHLADEIRESAKDKCVISIMAGITVERMKNALDASTRVLRVMPNLPAMVGESMTALCKENDLTEAEYDMAKDIFNAVGEICEVEEKHFDTVIGISGSGPAYAFIFIEALADAGVLHGLSRDVSYKLAAQMLKGSAQLVLDTQLHPGELKDRIASPAGTTIEAIKSLERDRFRSVVICAVDECVKKAMRMEEQ